ncbi:MAG: YceI family protein [Alphaproteobacteria bacterium]
MKRSLSKFLAFAVLGTAIVPTASFALDPYNEMPAGAYEIDKTHASLVWKVDHLGLSDYVARFTNIDATLDFDPSAPEKSTISVRIDPNSLRTDYPYPEEEDFDEKLSQGKDWMNSGEFPVILFESRSVERTGDKTGVMIGDLTFLGMTKSVSLDVEFNGAFLKKPFSGTPILGFSATGKIKRSEFGMGAYIPNIGDEVTIEIEAEFNKAQ